MKEEKNIIIELPKRDLEIFVQGINYYFSEYGSSYEERKLLDIFKKKLHEKNDDMNCINANEEPWDVTGEYLMNMVQRTTKDNSVTGRINNAEHGNVRVIMFIEDKTY